MKLHLLRLPRPILALLAKLYSFAVRLRLALYQTEYLKPKRLAAATISVGNLTVGGTGKTPLVETIARYLREQSYSVAILTRGYGRKNHRRRQVVSDGEQILEDVRLTGDEPYLLASHLPGIPIIADRDRYAAGKWAEEQFGTDIFILDDGFQHLALDRDVNLLVLDALDPFGGEQPLPLGRLREPVSEMARADAIIVTNSDQPFDQADLETRIRTLAGDKPIYYAYRNPTGIRNPVTGEVHPPQRLTGRAVSTLCAIGRPDRFLDDLRHFQAKILSRYPFPDHHYFKQSEIDRVFDQARQRGVEWILTTEKDWVKLKSLRIPDEPILQVLLSRLVVIEEAQLMSLILRKIEGRRSLSILRK